MPTKIAYSAAASTSGLVAPKGIYVTGGIPANDTGYPLAGENGNSLVVNWMQIYDLQTGVWLSGANMLTGRFNLAFLNINGKLFALGGQDSSQSIAA